MRVALYARVSTEDQTCEAQLAELRQHVQAQGWTVYREYIDHGISGASTCRPARDRLFCDAEQKRFDLVLVWRLDRLGRRLADLVAKVDRLGELQVAFKSLTEPQLDTSGPYGVVLFALAAAFAQVERQAISERTRAGMAQRKAAGVRMGAPMVYVDVELAQQLVTARGWKGAAKALSVSVSTLQRRLRGTGTQAETSRAKARRAGIARDYYGKRKGPA